MRAVGTAALIFIVLARRALETQPPLHFPNRVRLPGNRASEDEVARGERIGAAHIDLHLGIGVFIGRGIDRCNASGIGYRPNQARPIVDVLGGGSDETEGLIARE